MNDTANITLHIGALPVMAHAIEEVKEMAGLSSALVLNPGTLSHDWVETMKIAGKNANIKGIPIILDPVGAGATKYRTKTNLELLKLLKIAIIKGNCGEIGALTGMGGKMLGVESVESLDDPIKAAQILAKMNNNVVVITGKRDIIVSTNDIYYVDNGHELLTTITGSGCMATAMIGAFAAVEPDFAFAAASALAVYGLAAEIAAKNASGPVSFKVALLDAIYNLTVEQVRLGVKITKSQYI